MSVFRSFAAHSIPKLRHVLRYRSCDHGLISSPPTETTVFGHRNGLSANQWKKPSDQSNQESSGRRTEKMENSYQPAAPRPRKPIFPNWARWALATMLSLTLPFWKNTWVKLLTLEDEVEKAAEVVETAAEVVETAAEVVEKVANVAEKVSSEVAHKLPEDGKLKDAVLLVERLSKEAAKDAHLTIDLIHKVDELKQDVEALVEPSIDHKTHGKRDTSKK